MKITVLLSAMCVFLVACAPTIVSELSTEATERKPFEYQILADRNPTGFAADSLPEGLTVDTKSGLIAGTPEEAGEFRATIEASNKWGNNSANLQIQVLEAPHSVVIDKELMIIDQSVIGSNHGRPGGAWSFGTLVTDMAKVGEEGDFVKAWLLSWEADQIVNGVNTKKRTNIRQQVINPWKACDGAPNIADANWKPNLNHAPFRISAIVYRVDLATKASINEPIINRPEGRFVFDVLQRTGAACDTAGNALSFTTIFEYELPLNTGLDHLAWAKLWHQLGRLEFGGEFNQSLLQITNKFATRGASPNKPNGNALSQIRTNEIALSGPWELREFNLSKTGKLENVTVKRTPESGFKTNVLIKSYLEDHADEILAGLVLPDSYKGVDFVGGHSHASGPKWASGLGVDPTIRAPFALNTCGGCHLTETNTPFRHVVNRTGQGTSLSQFTRDDLLVRKCILDLAVGNTCGAVATLRSAQAPIRINRTH